MGWQDAPVVDSGQPAWMAAPVVGAPPPAAPMSRPGEIPGTQAPAPTAPKQAPGLLARLNAIGEMVIDQVLGGVGGTAGFLGGGAVGMAKDVAGLVTEGPSNYRGNEAKRLSEQGGQRGAEALRQSYYGMPFVGQPSKLGQEYSDTAGEAIQQNAPAFMAGPGGVLGMARQAPKGAAGTGLRAATDAAAGSKAAEAVRTGAAAVGEEARMVGGYVGDKVLPRIGDRQMKRLDAAVKNDIPVNLHQLSTNDFIRKLGETAESVGAGGTEIKRTRREKLSGALLRQINPESAGKVLDDTNFKAEQDFAGGKIGEIYENAPDIPRDAFGDLMNTVQDNDPAIRDTIGRFATQIDEAAEQHGGAIPGSTLREMRTRAAAQARETAGGKGDLSAAWDRVVKKLDDGLEQVVPEDQLPELFKFRKAYAISKALEPLVAAHPDGSFPVTSLQNILGATKQGKRRLARGEAGEMGTYNELGRQVLKETVTSGTAERGLVYSLLKGELAEKPGPVWGATLWAGGGIYNLLGPRLVKQLVERQQRRGLAPPKPEGPPPEPTLGAGFEDVPQGQPAAPAGPLGDLTPDWQTAPGVDGRFRPGEEPGLVPAVGEVTPAEERGVRLVSPVERPELVGPPRGGRRLPETVPPRATETEIPAVPGRPDLPDTMVAGAPGEVGGARRPLGQGPDAATEPVADVNAASQAMQAPEAALARQRQAEALQQRAQAVQSPEVKRVLETQAAKLALEAKRMKDAHDLRMEAAVTDEPAIRQALLDHAKRLERAEKVAIGEAKEGLPKEKPAKAEKIPAGEATELPAEEVVAPNPDLVFEDGKGWVKRSIPTGEATELPAETVVYDAKGRALEVGRTYTDNKGRRAVWQADGTWKILK